MFNQQLNHCGRRFQHEQFNYIMEAQAQFPQPADQSINFYQMNPQYFCTYQYGLQNNQFCSHFEPTQYSGFTSSFPEAGKSTVEEESEAVDELLQILVECLRKADIRTREILLKKFFYEIEKETPLEEFLVERIKSSKIKLFSELLESCRFFRREIQNADQTEEISVLATREIDGSSGVKRSKKPERFKVKTVQVGEVVKEEAK